MKNARVYYSRKLNKLRIFRLPRRIAGELADWVYYRGIWEYVGDL